MLKRLALGITGASSSFPSGAPPSRRTQQPPLSATSTTAAPPGTFSTEATRRDDDGGDGDDVGVFGVTFASAADAASRVAAAALASARSGVLERIDGSVGGGGSASANADADDTGTAGSDGIDPELRKLRAEFRDFRHTLASVCNGAGLIGHPANRPSDAHAVPTPMPTWARFS